MYRAQFTRTLVTCRYLFVDLSFYRYTTLVSSPENTSQGHTGQPFFWLMSFKGEKEAIIISFSFSSALYEPPLSLFLSPLHGPPTSTSPTPPTLPGYLALPGGGCSGWWVGSGRGLPDNCKQLGKLVAPASPSGGLLVYNLIGLHVKTVKAWEKQDASARWNSNCQPAQNIRTVCLIACNQRGKSSIGVERGLGLEGRGFVLG